MNTVLKQRFRIYLEELPNALMLAITTAVVTLILAVVLSTVLGAENVRHREASRCQSAHIVEILRDMSAFHGMDPDSISEINVEGLDCTQYLVEAFHERP